MKGMPVMNHDDAGMQAGYHDAEPPADETEPHTHADGQGHNDAKPAEKPPMDESKPDDLPPG